MTIQHDMSYYEIISLIYNNIIITDKLNNVFQVSNCSCTYAHVSLRSSIY